jgi:hypothetical protein
MFRSIQSYIPQPVQGLREFCVVTHLIGKFRRIYLVYLRREYVKRQLGLRKGECHQCGRCCSFLFACPMLTQERLCRIYGKCRSEVCKAFPIDQRDIDEVALCRGTCGYRFEKDL